MITNEMLEANEALSALTEEQKSAIVEISKADEGIVIGERIGRIYTDLDNDILAASGIAKNGAEKTYAYAKRVIGELKAGGNAEELKSQIATLTEEKAKLQKAIEEGAADAETKKALAQAKTDLADITKKYTDLNTQLEREKTKHQNEVQGLRVSMEIESAAKDIKFKPSIPESVTKVVLANVIEKMKGSADFVDSEGKKTLIFKGKEGEIMRDATLRPLNAADLLTRELSAMGVLEERRQRTGAGSTGEDFKNDPEVMDLSGAKTQAEADNIIHAALAARGLIRGTRAYQEAMDKAWKDNAVNKLPA